MLLAAASSLVAFRLLAAIHPPIIVAVGATPTRMAFLLSLAVLTMSVMVLAMLTMSLAVAGMSLAMLLMLLALVLGVTLMLDGRGLGSSGCGNHKGDREGEIFHL
jgi:hypothetical protein